MNKFPLRNVRILDLTQVIAGPVSTRLLSHMGAQVIKVETPWGRSLAAGTGVEGKRPDSKPYDLVPNFNEVNRAKLGMTMNLQNEEGRVLFKKLVSLCDVVIENYSPRVMPNLGLDYDELRKIKPDIIMVSMPAFGSIGPWANFIAFGPGTDALSGVCEITGYEDGPPMKPGNYYADQNGAFHTAYGVLLALWHRRRTGQGQRIESPLRDGLISIIGEKFLEYQLTGRVPTRIGYHHSSMAPHNVYPCQGEDKWVTIAIGSDEEWQSLCRVLGRADLASDERYRGVLGRQKHEKELDNAISEWTKQRSNYEAMNSLQESGVSAGAALTAPEMVEDPHYKERDSFDYTDHPDAGMARHSGLAWKMSRAPMNTGVPAPQFAQDVDWVLKEVLALPQDEIDVLLADKTVVMEPQVRG